MLRDDVDVSWLLSGEVPGYCYGLNRLLALLLARLHSHQRSRLLDAEARAGADAVILRTGKLEMVEPAPSARLGASPHTCSPGCHANPHRVHVRSTLEPLRPLELLGTFDVTVVRHGIQHRHHADFDGAPVCEQLVPFGSNL